MENKAEAKMKAPLILCEVLVYGLIENKGKMKWLLEKLQKQIDKSKTNKAKVRILWYLDNGEKTIEEKKQWLIEQSNCVFYVFAPEELKVPDNYISNLMTGVNLFDRSLGLMRKEGIVMKKTRQIQEVTIPSQPQAPLEILD